MPLFKTQTRRCTQATVVVDAPTREAAKRFVEERMTEDEHWPPAEDTIRGYHPFNWVINHSPYIEDKVTKKEKIVPEGTTIFVAPEDVPTSRRDRIRHARQALRS